VMYVADAVGGRSQTAHRTAIERLAQAVVTELFRDWGNAARGAGPRRHLLVLQRSPEAHRPGGRGGGGEARRCSRAGPLRRAGCASKVRIVTGVIPILIGFGVSYRGGAGQTPTKHTTRCLARLDKMLPPCLEGGMRDFLS